MNPSLLRLSLVSFAAVVTWRLTGGAAWPLLAPALVVVAQLGETILVSRFAERAGARLAEINDPANGSRLASAEAATSYPWVVASLAVLFWAAAFRWPGVVRLEVPLALLCCCHATAFRVAQKLGWAEAAASVAKTWRERLALPGWQRLRSAEMLWIPKRGLLTTGKLRVGQVESLRDDLRPEDVLRMGAALYRSEGTPLGEVLQQAARRAHLALPRLQDATALPDGTRAGTIDDRRYHLGSLSLARKLGFTTESLKAGWAGHEAAGGTMLLLLDETGPAGLLAVEDPLRSGAAELSRLLRSAGAPKLGVLSDDPPDTAKTFGEALGYEASVGEVTDTNCALAIGSEPGAAALLTRPSDYPSGAMGAEATIWLVAEGEAVPADAELVIRGDDPAPAVLAWAEATATRDRDRQRVRRIFAKLTVVVAAAMLACPLPILVALDAAVVLLELTASLRRVA